MTSNVEHVVFAKESRRGGPGGPEDPTMEKRVAALEEKVGRVELKLDRVDEALRRIEAALKDLALDTKDLRRGQSDLTAKIASVEGQLKNVPSVLQLLLALITTWSAGTAIVFALLKATHP